MSVMLFFVLFSLCLKYDSLFASGAGVGELKCIEKEREALLRFKQDLIDEDDILSSWGSEDDENECCKWRGITCSNETGHVITLQLSSKDSRTPLRGKISSALLELDYLSHLDLSHNDFGYDEIPKFIGCLKRLQHLNLGQSNFSGIVPDLRQLVSLKELRLNDNKLERLPKSLWELSMLEILDVSFNSFKGTIVEGELSKLHNLKVLDLSYNSLVLNFSHNWIPPLQLHDISLASCKVGPYFPTWLRTLTNFSKLDLSSAGISDELPKWFWDLSPRISYLNLSYNQISGMISDLSSNFVDLGVIDISYNNFSGLIPSFPPKSMILRLSSNKFLGPISSICTTTYDALLVLDISDNKFSGELPNCWENMRELHILNLANNELSGQVPDSFGSLWSLQTLHLRGNNFSGELPSTLKNCQKLVMIDVGGNELTGKVPTWIGTHLTGLIVLSLGHNNFDGIPLEICHLTEIQVLDLSKNSISGRIPQCFGNFTSLVQKNITTKKTIFEFPFGSYPSYGFTQYIGHTYVQWKGQETECRKTLGLLKLIDLSRNKLVGDIPREFSHLRALISLNLSRNYLSGNIISEIGQMEMLESLDLSRNHFFGEIPIGLAELHFLAVLDLSNNNLSGRIPSSTQLQSFNASVYAGNKELCGRPLTSCQGSSPDPSITDNRTREIGDEDDDGFITHEFVISMALGFILAFWGVVCYFIAQEFIEKRRF